jgi:hypothetical protein
MKLALRQLIYSISDGHLGSKSRKNSKILLQPVLELQVTFRVNCTSGFKFGRTGTVFKLSSAIFAHSYLKKFRQGHSFTLWRTGVAIS